MKLVYTALLLMSVLKWAASKPLNASSSFNISAPAAQLVEYYNSEYDLLAQEICAQLKNITDEMLKDAVVQKAATPLMQTLKKNLTEFQQYYPYLKRFGLNGALMWEFSELIKDFYYPSRYANSSDSLYTQKLLKKLGYNEIRDTQRNKFKTFFEEKFLTKFAQLQANFNNEKTKTPAELELKVLKWISFLKACQDYECFLVDFLTYQRTHARVLERIFGEIFHALFKALIIYVDNATIFAQAVLRDSNLSQLSSVALKQQLNKNMQDIIKVQESFTEFSQIFLFQPISYMLLYRFNDYASISVKDRQLITSIFNDHGYASLHFEDKEEELTKTDLLKEYEHKRAALSPKELAQQQSFLEAVDRLVKASSRQEKEETFRSLAELLNDNVIIK